MQYLFFLTVYEKQNNNNNNNFSHELLNLKLLESYTLYINNFCIDDNHILHEIIEIIMSIGISFSNTHLLPID